MGSGPHYEWATPGFSKSFPEATPVFSWWYASGYCLVEMSTFTPAWALWERFSLRIALYFAASLSPSILRSLHVSFTEKHPHIMMLPPPCLTVGRVLMR